MRQTSSYSLTDLLLLTTATLQSNRRRILVVVSAIPLVLQLVLLPLVPESPRYLLVKGKTDKAEQSLKRVLRMCGKPAPPGRLRPLKEKAAPPPAADMPCECASRMNQLLRV